MHPVACVGRHVLADIVWVLEGTTMNDALEEIRSCTDLIHDRVCCVVHEFGRVLYTVRDAAARRRWPVPLVQRSVLGKCIAVFLDYRILRVIMQRCIGKVDRSMKVFGVGFDVCGVDGERELISHVCLFE